MSAEAYIQELAEEKDVLNPREFQHAIRLINQEIQHVRANNDDTFELPHHGSTFNSPPPAKRFFEEEVVKVSEKVVLPIEEFPRFNFVGKLIGPKGSTLKSIQANSKTKISILGRGSTRDRVKEEELSKSDDPKNEHFKEPLHVLIQVSAPRSEAHQRIADCLVEINRCMDPENEEDHMEERHYEPNVRRQGGMEIAGLPGNMPVNGMSAPIIRVGIPPPGAIILNAAPPGMTENHRPDRRGGHGGRGGNRGSNRGAGRGDRRGFRGGQRSY